MPVAPADPDAPPHAPAKGSAEPRIIVVTSRPRLWAAFGSELFQYRDLALSLVYRDVVLRYKQTLLGPTWVLLQPLLTAGVFSFLFGAVAKVPLHAHVPYFAFAIVGMALWTGFSQTMTRCTASLLSNAPVVTKIYFPRFLLPLSCALATLLDTLLMLIIAEVVLLSVGVYPTWRLAAAPLIIGGLLAVALATASALAAIFVRFRDIGYGLPVLIQTFLFLTPVLYPLASVPHRLRLAVEANPLTFSFEALRWSVFDVSPPSGTLGLYSLVVTLFFGIGCLAIFSRLQRDIADTI